VKIDEVASALAACRLLRSAELEKASPLLLLLREPPTTSESTSLISLCPVAGTGLNREVDLDLRPPHVSQRTFCAKFTRFGVTGLTASC
jgi:hypothetical protein